MSYRGAHVEIHLYLLDCDGYALYVAFYIYDFNTEQCHGLNPLAWKFLVCRTNLNTIASTLVGTHSNSVPVVVSVRTLCDEGIHRLMRHHSERRGLIIGLIDRNISI